MIYYNTGTGDEGSIQFKPVSRFKLALWLILIASIALALVLTFASLFVFAAIVMACLAALAVVAGWVKRLMR